MGAKRWFWYGIAFSALAGIVLRLWAIGGQVLLDDEWHALNFVIGKSLGDMFLKQGLGANSIPVNIYTWLVLQTVGWSEPLLRLPALVAGSAAVVVIPLLVRRIWDERVALLAASLLAVAPTLIFYSRVARPYGPIMLFGPTAVLLTLAWAKEGRRRDLVLAALVGSLAIYYHLYALIPVGGTLGMCGLLALLSRRQRLLASPTRWVDLSLAAALLIVIDGVLVVLPNLLNPWWSKGIHNKDHATLKTATDLLELVAGTPVVPCMVLALVLALVGACLVVKRTPVLGVPLLAPLLVFAGVAAVTTQEGSQAAIQVVRYGITFVPLVLVLIAVAVARIMAGLLDSVDATQFWTGRGILVIAWLPFLATSPLWRTYQMPNNFTNQSAYQYHYESHDWETSPERDLAAGIVMYRADIPSMYGSPLLARFPGIIEYPMLLGDHFNFYYYYQHFHRRPVRVGYVPNLNLGWRRDQYVIANQTIDHVLRGLSPEQLARSNWRSMVNLADPAALRQHYPGWLVILHNDPLGEAFPGSPDASEPYPYIAITAGIMQQAFGTPVFSDRLMSGWVIR